MQTISATPLYSPLVGEDGLVHDPAWLEWFNRVTLATQMVSLTGALLRVNNLSDVANVATSRTNLGLGTGDSPSFTGLTLSGLTASLPVVTDGSKRLVSISYADLAATLGIGGTGSVTVSSLTVDNLSGILKATSGFVGTLNVGDSLDYAIGLLDTIQDIRVSASPEFTGLTLSGLTASVPIVSNGSKALVSLAYTGSTSFRKNLGLETSDSPTFTGLTLSGLSASKVVVSDGSKALASGTNTDAEIASAVSLKHAAVTLSSDLDTNLLGLSTQQLTLDTQAANYVFAGPTTGGAAAPAFRALLSADLPTTISVTGLNLSGLSASRLVVTDGSKNLASNGSLTTNALPRAASSGATLADSQVSDDGSNVTITSLAGTGTRAVIVDTNGVLSAPVSDARFKTNIKGLRSEIAISMLEDPNIYAINYTWKDKAKGEAVELGFTYQMFERHGVAGLTFFDKGFGGVNYEKLTAILWEQNRVLLQRIRKLEEANARV